MVLHNFNHEMTAFFFVEEHISYEEMVEEYIIKSKGNSRS
jgi:hypothetical protein